MNNWETNNNKTGFFSKGLNQNTPIDNHKVS